MDADLLIVGEPNNRGEISGGNWKVNIDGDAAILLLNTRRAILQNVTSRGFVWVDLTEFRVFSCYFSVNRRMDDFLLVLKVRTSC